MSPPQVREPSSAHLLAEMAEVKGMLRMQLQLAQQNHDAVNRRLDDFRHAVEGRIDGVEGRIEGLETRVGNVERNERNTAVKSAGASAITLAVVELVKFLAGR